MVRVTFLRKQAEVLKPDGNNDYRVTGSSGGGSSKNYAIQEAAADMVSFTSEELAEIERVEGIISDAEADENSAHGYRIEADK